MTIEENTYAFDTESTVEMARLINQDRVITLGMGGPLTGILDLPAQAQVLDLGCGPGGWVLDAAHARPDIELAGVDVSKTMIDYANARARTQKLTNATFGIMNITEPLDFSDASFDLVNARLLVAALKREAWEPFLAECTRVLKPGGLLRFTEPVDFGITNSLAYERVMAMLSQALWKLGYGFSVDGRTYGMTNTLPRMFRDAHFQEVHCVAHALEFSADSEGWQDMYDNFKAGASVAAPLYSKAGVGTVEAIAQTYQQLFQDMLSPDFRGMWHMVTVLGTKP